MDKNEIYQELKIILLNSKKPSIEILKMIDEGKFDNPPLNTILKLKLVKQNPEFHKEGNVFNHTMLVIDKASEERIKSNDQLVLMLSALLHDIGKINTTKLINGKWTSYNHDKESSKMVYDFLEGLEEKNVIESVSKMTLFHMQSLFFKNGLSQKVKRDIIKSVNTEELMLLTIADRTGRVNIDEEKELRNINEFYEYLKKWKLPPFYKCILGVFYKIGKLSYN